MNTFVGSVDDRYFLFKSLLSLFLQHSFLPIAFVTDTSLGNKPVTIYSSAFLLAGGADYGYFSHETTRSYLFPSHFLL